MICRFEGDELQTVAGNENIFFPCASMAWARRSNSDSVMPSNKSVSSRSMAGRSASGVCFQSSLRWKNCCTLSIIVCFYRHSHLGKETPPSGREGEETFLVNGIIQALSALASIAGFPYRPPLSCFGFAKPIHDTCGDRKASRVRAPLSGPLTHRHCA